MLRTILTAMLIALAAPPSLALAESRNDDHIKQLALDAILENPEIIAQAITILRDREEERRLSDMRLRIDLYRDDLENDPNAPVLGNADGDIVVVEFFDYNCPYCKNVAPDVLRLISEDPNIKLVYREWPILGEGSVYAARAALAAREQGKYEEMHWALMSLRRAEKETVLAAATELGLDIQKLEDDMQSSDIDEHLNLSMQLANAMGFSGTPSFVFGNQVAPGAISLAKMRELVDASRNPSDNDN